MTNARDTLAFRYHLRLFLSVLVGWVVRCLMNALCAHFYRAATTFSALGQRGRDVLDRVWQGALEAHWGGTS
jgi:hypothetical protein